MRHLSGKRAVITGAASGIGRALALRLAAEGTHLWLLDIDQPGLEETAQRAATAGVEVIATRRDVARPSDISEAVQQMLRTWTTFDLLVNNAGVCYYGSTTAMSPEQWDWVLAVNLLGPIQLTRELLPTLRARPEAHIVNVGSVYGLLATNRCCAYHVSKFGLAGFSEALRAEYGRHGLGVTAVCPGFVDTNLYSSMACDHEHRRRRPPWWLTTTPEKVAHQIVRGIQRNHRLVVTPWSAKLMYFGKRFFPGILDWIQHLGRGRKMREKLARLSAQPESGDPSASRPDPADFEERTAA